MRTLICEVINSVPVIFRRAKYTAKRRPCEADSFHLAALADRLVVADGAFVASRKIQRCCVRTQFQSRQKLKSLKTSLRKAIPTNGGDKRL